METVTEIQEIIHDEVFEVLSQNNFTASMVGDFISRIDEDLVESTSYIRNTTDENSTIPCGCFYGTTLIIRDNLSIYDRSQSEDVVNNIKALRPRRYAFDLVNTYVEHYLLINKEDTLQAIRNLLVEYRATVV